MLAQLAKAQLELIELIVDNGELTLKVLFRFYMLNFKCLSCCFHPKS